VDKQPEPGFTPPGHARITLLHGLVVVGALEGHFRRNPHTTASQYQQWNKDVFTKDIESAGFLGHRGIPLLVTGIFLYRSAGESVCKIVPEDFVQCP
jgi:hypothetical protein